jgi:hypothetical protein
MALGIGHNKHKVQHVSLGEHGSFDVHKGKLHKALGIPEDEKIPASAKEPHNGDSPEMKRMRASAKGFSKMSH